MKVPKREVENRSEIDDAFRNDASNVGNDDQPQGAIHPIVSHRGAKLNETPNAGKSGEDMRKARALRLSSLLQELVRQEGRMKAALLLGVNYKTVVRAEESGRITGRMGDALERLLGRADDPGQSRLQQRIESLEENLETLAEEMQRGFADIRTAVEVHSHVKTQSQMKDWEELSRPKVVTAPSVKGLQPSKPASRRRTIPELVTVEPTEDDAKVYGKAWPLVEEWRRLRVDHPSRGNTLSWLTTEERLLTLELSMMEQHGLTLPPETQPLRGFGRRDQIAWRREALHDTRKAFARRRLLRWVRRVLTLGLWRR